MENEPKFRPDPALRLMDQMRQVLRYHHYTYRTEQAYWDWIVRFIQFHGGKTHPRDMGKTEIDAFLSHLAVEGMVSVSMRSQALNALVFIYKHMLDLPMEGKIEAVGPGSAPGFPWS